MTPAEIERKFGVPASTIRGIIRNSPQSIPHRRPDQRTILIPRSFALKKWGFDKSEYEVVITEEHLGGDAIHEQAEKMVGLMTERGWNISYGSSLQWPFDDNTPANVQRAFDSDWNKFLAEL